MNSPEKQPPLSPSQLMDLWLNDAATPEQAEQLWRLLAEKPELAHELASLARFDHLLGETLRSGSLEKVARNILTAFPRQQGAPRPTLYRTRQVFTQSWVGVAAGLALLALVSALIWKMDMGGISKITKKEAKEPANAKIAGVKAPRGESDVSQKKIPLSGFDADTLARTTAPLTARLESYFLEEVNLHPMALSLALKKLQDQLTQTDKTNKLPLENLRITVPSGAASRIVSLKAGSIPFMKAVQALAALAGCEVQATEAEIQLQLLPTTYPLVVENRNLSDLLAGRLSAEGKPISADPDRLNELWQDAASLGIQITPEGIARMSRGQWEALKLMTDARDEIWNSSSVPSYFAYLVPENLAPSSDYLTAEETSRYAEYLKQNNIQPRGRLKPKVKGNPADLEDEDAKVADATTAATTPEEAADATTPEDASASDPAVAARTSVDAEESLPSLTLEVLETGSANLILKKADPLLPNPTQSSDSSAITTPALSLQVPPDSALVLRSTSPATLSGSSAEILVLIPAPQTGTSQANPGPNP